MSDRVVKRRRSSKSVQSKKARRREVADYISSFPENFVSIMVACTECINHGSACYYDREQSVACFECLKNRRRCDGIFSVNELRKWGEKKVRFQEQSLAKQKEIADKRKDVFRKRKDVIKVFAELNAVKAGFANIEDENNKFFEIIAALEDRSRRRLRREMMALGVLKSINPQTSVAPANPDFI